MIDNIAYGTNVRHFNSPHFASVQIGGDILTKVVVLYNLEYSMNVYYLR